MKSYKINEKNIEIRKIENEGDFDFFKLCEKHLTIFPDGLIANLGIDFLENYYKSLLALSTYHLYVATESEKYVGFIGYIYSQKDIKDLDILKQAKKEALFRLFTLRMNPIVIARAWLKKHYGKPVVNLPELMMIAVDSEYRRHGIGAKLVSIMEKDLLEHKFSQYCVYTDNPEGLNFYNKMGFRTVFRFNFFGKVSACFLKDLQNYYDRS